MNRQALPSGQMQFLSISYTVITLNLTEVLRSEKCLLFKYKMDCLHSSMGGIFVLMEVKTTRTRLTLISEKERTFRLLQGLFFFIKWFGCNTACHFTVKHLKFFLRKETWWTIVTIVII